MIKSTIARPFEEYSKRFKHIRITRRDGIIELCVHTDGDSLKWGALPHEELGYCFQDVANDPENKVVIITGAGDVFCTETDIGSWNFTPQNWAHIHQESKRLLNSLLDIEAPIIGAVNGPAHIHAELAVMSDIVIASDRATFGDSVHFSLGVVPGDGVQAIWPALLGPNRGRYFLLMGQELSVREALDLGVVSEIVPQEDLSNRAWAIAEQIAARPAVARRYARVLLTQEIKRLMQEQLSYGLGLEGLALMEFVPANAD